MSNFWLIQRGTFNKAGKSLTGSNGVVSLDYMGAAEFEWGAIPKSYRRILYHFTEYEVVGTGIYTPEHDELMVFCKKDSETKIIEAIRQFIKKPYPLKEYSELEKVPHAKKGDKSFNGRQTNFWWCIDIDPCGDWMAFLASSRTCFDTAINNDYKFWWLAKTPEEREEDYKTSLRW